MKITSELKLWQRQNEEGYKSSCTSETLDSQKKKCSSRVKDSFDHVISLTVNNNDRKQIVMEL